jgi:flagellar basal-body rod modification protein FlgD
MNSSEFMQLLVAQLQNQNPLSPTDPTTFITQTSQLTMVQALQNLETSTTQSNQEIGVMASSSMIGRTISGTLSDGTPFSGTVSSVQVTSSGPQLNIGSSSVPLSSVTSIA